MGDVINRRKFLKQCGQAALAVAGAATLNSLLGCAPQKTALSETKEDVTNIQWECNPVLPIPHDKIYTGTNSRIPIDVTNEWWEKNYGLTPTFFKPTWAAIDALNDIFPKAECEFGIRHGAIPTVNWVLMPFDGYKPITQGKFDDDIRRFAHQLAAFEHPIVLLPFEQPNVGDRRLKVWCDYPGSQYVDAWVHMHELCKREGANKNTVWSTKLKYGTWRYWGYPDPFQYIPPKEYVDIIGWAVCDLNRPDMSLESKSLAELCGYSWVAHKYPTKPQMLWEFSSNQDRWQHRWLDRNLTYLENKYPKLKGVMLDEISVYSLDARFGYYKATLTSESVKVIAKHFSSGKYVGSILKKSPISLASGVTH